MALRRKALLAFVAALAAFALIRRAFPANRVTVRRRTRHNSDVDSSNCALLANGTRGFLTYAPADGAGLGAQLAALRNALFIAHTVGRTLAIPPLSPPARASTTTPTAHCTPAASTSLAQRALDPAAHRAAGDSWSSVLNLDAVARAASVDIVEWSDVLNDHGAALRSPECAAHVSRSSTQRSPRLSSRRILSPPPPPMQSRARCRRCCGR